MIRVLRRTMSTAIAKQLLCIQNNITAAAKKRLEVLQYVQPRLVAVSKTKGVEMIMNVYDAGQRHFGENYVAELHEKANDIELQDHCEDIRWHFIGHLQRNKVSKLLDVPNLFVIESVDSIRLAKAIDDGWARLDKQEPLRVMVQCNTSQEQNKSGCMREEVLPLVKNIREQCPHLNLIGLMTIGIYGFDASSGPNPDFQCLVSIREEISNALDISTKDLELSMGMSSDYEHAIEMGSTNVRIGSIIFGPRNAAKDAIKKNENDAPQTGSTDGDSTDQVKNLKIS